MIKLKTMIALSALTCITVTSFVALTLSSPYNQPYTIYLEEVTPRALWWCQRDSNCMDMRPSSELPLRDDVAMLPSGPYKGPELSPAYGGCTTDAECCQKAPQLDPELCGPTDAHHGCFTYKNKSGDTIACCKRNGKMQCSNQSESETL